VAVTFDRSVVFSIFLNVALITIILTIINIEDSLFSQTNGNYNGTQKIQYTTLNIDNTCEDE